MTARTKGSYGTMYYVDDMEKATRFYRTALGVDPRAESPYWTEFDLGDGNAICLHWTEGKKAPAPGGVAIARVASVKDVVATLKADAVDFLRDIHEVHPGMYSADFRDPEGNVVSLYGPE